MARRRTSEDDSATRTALLDAAEELMVEEGYAAVTTRRVGAVAEVNKALVHYYFGTMDELFIALFRRNAERSLDRLAGALLSPQPLWGYWDAIRDVSSGALVNEFIALANHRKVVHTEIASYSRKHRQMELDVLTRVLKGYGVELPPVVIILAISAISQYIRVEDGFDIQTGHAEMISVIERQIRELEGERMTVSTERCVDQARASGASWSQIGAAMGVSKQAAQKRFVAREDELAPEGKTFSRFTPRARASVAAAGQLAAAGGADAVDGAHLAAGLLLDPDGLAAHVVQRLEVSDGQYYLALGVGPAPDRADPDPPALRELQFTASCRGALKEALKAALRLGHNYIGTEHLLLGVTAGRSAVAERLAAVGLQPTLIESALAVELAEMQLRRQRHSG